MCAKIINCNFFYYNLNVIGKIFPEFKAIIIVGLFIFSYVKSGT